MLMMSITPKINVRPAAIRAYTPPVRIPSTMASIRAVDDNGQDPHPGLGNSGATDPVADFGRVCTRLPFCHWNTSELPIVFSPLALNFAGPMTVLKVAPLCR